MSVILDEELEPEEDLKVKAIKKKLKVNDIISMTVLIPTVVTRLWNSPWIPNSTLIFKIGVVLFILLVFRRYFLTYKLNKAS